jgi:hypothetical protein
VLTQPICHELTSISQATTSLGRLVVNSADDLDVYAQAAALLQLASVRATLEALADGMHDRVHGDLAEAESTLEG